jgi:hypothetical protein
MTAMMSVMLKPESDDVVLLVSSGLSVDPVRVVVESMRFVVLGVVDDSNDDDDIDDEIDDDKDDIAVDVMGRVDARAGVET